MNNKERRKLLDEALAIGSDDFGELIIDHSKMKFPKNLKELEFKGALNRANKITTKTGERKFWREYRSDLKEALFSRMEWLKNQSESVQVHEINYNWNVLLDRIELRIDKLSKDILMENFESSSNEYGVHQGNAEWIASTWEKVRKEESSNNKADEKVIELYKKEFNGLSISKRQIQRFTRRD